MRMHAERRCVRSSAPNAYDAPLAASEMMITTIIISMRVMPSRALRRLRLIGCVHPFASLRSDVVLRAHLPVRAARDDVHVVPFALDHELVIPRIGGALRTIDDTRLDEIADGGAVRAGLLPE